MFFDDADLGPTKQQSVYKIPPPIPETGWKPPVSFPNLKGAKAISFDCETKELDFDKGPGWGRNKGHIIGFSVAAADNDGAVKSWYFPVRHEVCPEQNMDPAICFAWLKEQLETPHIAKIGANLLYDIGWLTTENIFVQGDLHDVQFAEALLHEDGLVNLDYLGEKYLKSGKETNLLYSWLASAYGGEASGKQRANLFKAPPSLVGFYAEKDAELPLRILSEQIPLLEEQELYPVYRMECDSIPLLTMMRLTGVNIDLIAAEQLHAELAIEIQRLTKVLHDQTGIHTNVNSGADLARLFDHLELQYPRTAKGAPSFTAGFLQTVDHPIAQLIRDIREHEKIRGTFLQSYILESNVNGRVHCQFHPLRGDAGGTRSGRFSSDKPNLQNIPVRTELGKKVRKLFIPDDGHVCWEKDDYSQIEYRKLVHFAVGPGADAARMRYNSDPKTDYHVMTQELVKEIAGLSIDRKPIKNINFGLLYGMGEPKLAKQIGVDKEKAKQVFGAYHKGNPYVKATMEATADEAQKLGYITTILKRRSRFNLWEPMSIDYDNRQPALPYRDAILTYGPNIMRSLTHKAINRRLQGSSADMIKAGMLRCFKEGVFNVIGVPKLQVHDELDFSVRDDSLQQQEAFAYMRHVLETAIPLRVPVIVESERGKNWGDTK